MDIEFGLCGCGKEGQYSTPKGPSCNKYNPCPTYDDLLKESDKYRQEKINLEVDLMNAKLVIGDLTLKLRQAKTGES